MADLTLIVMPERGQRWLSRTAINAIRATTPERHQVIVQDWAPDHRVRRYGSEDAGWKILQALRFPLNGYRTWSELADVFVMHNDAAPLRRGWLSYLRDVRGQQPWAAFSDSRSVGCLYRKDWLLARLEEGRTFMPQLPTFDVGDKLVEGTKGVVIQDAWWKSYGGLTRDYQGRPLYLHLGGGTVGAAHWRPPARWWWRRTVRRLIEEGRQA